MAASLHGRSAARVARICLSLTSWRVSGSSRKSLTSRRASRDRPGLRARSTSWHSASDGAGSRPPVAARLQTAVCPRSHRRVPQGVCFGRQRRHVIQVQRLRRVLGEIENVVEAVDQLVIDHGKRREQRASEQGRISSTTVSARFSMASMSRTRPSGSLMSDKQLLQARSALDAKRPHGGRTA